MTTKVTVDAHAGWPVKVEAIDTFPDAEPTRRHIATVPANAVQDFYVHSTRQLIITELSKEVPK